MKRYVLTIFPILGICFCVGCSSSRSSDVPQKITGEIMVVGNEPFTKLAARTTNGAVYIIGCDEEIRGLLLSHQGKIADLFYNAIQKNNSGDEINVIKVIFYSK